MNTLYSIVMCVKSWLTFLLWFFQARSMSELNKDLEILALRSQLALVHQDIINNKMKKPRVNPEFRQLWVLLSTVFTHWKASLLIVQPQTVIG